MSKKVLRRFLHLACFLLLGTFLVSCARSWYLRYIEVPSKDLRYVEGWFLEFDINVPGLWKEDQTKLDSSEFQISVDATKRMERSDSVVYSIDFDSLTLKAVDGHFECILVPCYRQWLSYSTERELKRIFHFCEKDTVPGNPYYKEFSARGTMIPKSADSLSLTAFVSLSRGELIVKEEMVECDSVKIDSSFVPLKSQYTIQLYRHTSSHWVLDTEH